MMNFQFCGKLNYWAACGSQLWNEPSLSKKDKMVDCSPRRHCVSHSPYNGADFCEEGIGHLRQSSEQIWKSIWNEHKIIEWSYQPYMYIHAKLLSKYSILCCYQPVWELQKQRPPTVPAGKASTCCNSLPACEKSFLNMLFVDCPNKRALNAISDRGKTKILFALWVLRDRKLLLFTVFKTPNFTLSHFISVEQQ